MTDKTAEEIAKEIITSVRKGSYEDWVEVISIKLKFYASKKTASLEEQLKAADEVIEIVTTRSIFEKFDYISCPAKMVKDGKIPVFQNDKEEILKNYNKWLTEAIEKYQSLKLSSK